MDDYQKKSVEHYQKVAQATGSTTESAGRYSHDSGKEQAIWHDIKSKVDFARARTFLDIGCGYGPMTHMALRDGLQQNSSCHFFDIPEVIENLKTQSPASPLLHFHGGVFPTDASPLAGLRGRCDLILAYSVIHYTSEPMAFVTAAVELLAVGGRLLIGDLPNIHKKGRFLASDRGRAFEASYRKVPLEQVPVYADQFDYINRGLNQNPAISDDFVAEVFTQFRRRGFDVYLLPQHEGMPFGFTREDILIVRNQPA